MLSKHLRRTVPTPRSFQSKIPEGILRDGIALQFKSECYCLNHNKRGCLVPAFYDASAQSSVSNAADTCVDVTAPQTQRVELPSMSERMQR